MTVAEGLKLAEARLEAAGLETPRTEAAALLENLLGLSRSELYLSHVYVLTPAELDQLEGWLERREHREPLQHIVGTAPFYGLELRVTPDTLIPRPETEMLVAYGLEALAGIVRPKVLDVGTGSGAVALALKNERPGRGSVGHRPLASGARHSKRERSEVGARGSLHVVRPAVRP